MSAHRRLQHKEKQAMKTLKRILMAAALGLGMLATAQAATFASAVLEIQNLRLLHTPNGASFRVSDFATLDGTNDAQATAQLNLFSTSDFGSASIIALPPNVDRQCAGPCFTGPDIFAHLPNPNANFGYADQNLTGSSIAPNGGDAPGAFASTRADAGTLTSPNDASGNSNVGTSTTFRFSVAEPGSMTVQFDAIPYLQAFVSAGSVFNTNANAGLTWNISILDLTTGELRMSESPAALNQSRSRTNGATGTTTYDPGLSSYQFTTDIALETDHEYQLTIRHDTSADALQQEVPEPGTLAVLAAGLMSMSLVNRRRSKK